MCDGAMEPVYAQTAEKIIQFYKEAQNHQRNMILVGIAGPPGAGKSTTASALHKIIPRSLVVPMDGYHYRKSQLQQFPNPEEAFARRGAEWTFDAEKFVHDLRCLKETGHFSFPSFDHGVGDPVEAAITVDRQLYDVVLVEGNYLLLPEDPWNKLKDENILDLSIFIHADLEVVNDRVYKRHIGVGRSPQVAKERVETNDSLNAQKILRSADRADLVIHSI